MDNLADKIFLKGIRPFVWIGFLAVILYGQCLSFGLVQKDDGALIYENKDIVGNIANLPAFFLNNVYLSHFLPEAYRPMMNVSLAADFIMANRFGQLWPFHMMNIVYFIVFLWLFYYLLLRLGFDKRLSLPAVLLFCLHPAFVSNVAWIPGRNDLLLGIFSLSAFIFLDDYIFASSGRGMKALCFCIFLAAALFTKENAIVLPFLAGLWAYLFDKPKNIKKFIIDHWRIAAGTAGVVFFWYVLRAAVIGAVGGGLSAAGAIGVFTSNWSVPLQYVGKFFLPIILQPSGAFAGFYLLPGISFVILLAAVFTISKPSGEATKKIYFGVSWFVAFILPTLLSNYDLESRILVPSLGIVIIILALVPKNFNFDKKKIIAPAYFIILILLFWASLAYSRAFEGALSYRLYGARHATDRYWAENFYADYFELGGPGLADGGDTKELSEAFLASHTMDPYSKGLSLARQGKYEEAKKYFKDLSVQDIKSGIYYFPFFWAYLDTAATYYLTGEKEASRAIFKDLVKRYPGNILDDLPRLKSHFAYYFKDLTPSIFEYWLP